MTEAQTRTLFLSWSEGGASGLSVQGFVKALLDVEIRTAFNAEGPLESL
jgi:hypothetical protein